MRELLVVIDYQNDFVTGALGNPAAAALEPGIAARVAAQLERGGRVLFTRDTHGTDYLNTREGRFLPVAHCIKGSQGWGLYGSLSQYETGVRDGVSIVDKPTFGCAALPAEAEALCGGAPDSIGDGHLCGEQRRFAAFGLSECPRGGIEGPVRRRHARGARPCAGPAGGYGV